MQDGKRGAQRENDGKSKIKKKGLFVPAKPLFAAKQAEVRDLETRVSQLELAEGGAPSAAQLELAEGGAPSAQL